MKPSVSSKGAGVSPRRCGHPQISQRGINTQTTNEHSVTHRRCVVICHPGTAGDGVGGGARGGRGRWGSRSRGQKGLPV